jgi:hypothetical protein
MAHLTLIKSSVLALALIAAGPAAAEESYGARVAAAAASSVGTWIANQGNQALREIREDLRDNLADKIKPFLPAPAEVTPPAATTADAR